MKLNNVDFDTYFKNYPNKEGYFGKYGGVYVPPHQAVIHQFAREMLAGGGRMILGSDSHTRYGALGTMAMGEGGPELVKQLLNKTYDICDFIFVIGFGDNYRRFVRRRKELVGQGGGARTGFALRVLI